MPGRRVNPYTKQPIVTPETQVPTFQLRLWLGLKHHNGIETQLSISWLAGYTYIISFTAVHLYVIWKSVKLLATMTSHDITWHDYDITWQSHGNTMTSHDSTMSSQASLWHHMISTEWQLNCYTATRTLYFILGLVCAIPAIQNWVEATCWLGFCIVPILLAFLLLPHVSSPPSPPGSLWLQCWKGCVYPWNSSTIRRLLNPHGSWGSS